MKGKPMLKGVYGFLLASLLLIPAARAADCAYCAKLDELKKGLSQVKPHSQDEEEIDRQLKLLDETEKLARKVLGAKALPAKADWERILSLLAAAAAFDDDNTLAENVSAALCPSEAGSCGRLDKFHQEIDRQKKAGLLSAQQADDLHVAYGTAEHTRAHGTDDDSDAKKND
jgi:hypothetical protein